MLFQARDLCLNAAGNSQDENNEADGRDDVDDDIPK